MSVITAPLGNLIKSAKSARAGDREFPILSMTMHEGLVDQASKFKKRIASDDTSAYKVVRRGQLVVGFPIDEGVLSFQNLYDEAIVSPAYDIWDITQSDTIDRSYLQKFLRSPHALSFYRGNLRSTTARRRTIPKDTFLGLEVPLPTLNEQKRIVAILDQADELRRKRQRALDRLAQLGQAIFHEMFGDPTTNPKAWPTVKARELATRITVGLVVKPASYYQETGVPAIRGTNIKATGIDLSDVVYFSERDNETNLSKSRIWTDDIVIVRSGRPGLAAIVTPELNGINSIDVLIFSPNKEMALPTFVRDLINSEGGKRLVLSESRGQVQQHFNVGSLSEAEFFLPPLDLQKRYEDRLRSLQKQVEHGSSALIESNGLFASLQHRAFRGEL